MGRPSTEVLVASWRQADPPGETMELLRFALGAPPLHSRHRIACPGQQVAAVGAAGLDAIVAVGHARQSGLGRLSQIRRRSPLITAQRVVVGNLD